MHLIAHRGLWWPDRGSQNAAGAIGAAFASGFGVEVDVRRAGKALVLSHDSPSLTSALFSFADFLNLASEHPDLPLLINVKEPGIEAPVARALWDCHLSERAWLFDFELCGADPLAAKAASQWTQCLARGSDRGEDPFGAKPPWADGWWLDQMDGDWVTNETVRTLQGPNPVFVAAPDLHGRPFDFAKLSEWVSAAGICTDIPHLVQAVLECRAEAVPPADAWWLKGAAA